MRRKSDSGGGRTQKSELKVGELPEFSSPPPSAGSAPHKTASECSSAQNSDCTSLFLSTTNLWLEFRYFSE